MQIVLTHEHADAVLGLDDIRAVQPFSPVNDIEPTPIFLNQHAMDRYSSSRFCFILRIWVYIQYSSGLIYKKLGMLNIHFPTWWGMLELWGYLCYFMCFFLNQINHSGYTFFAEPLPIICAPFILQLSVYQMKNPFFSTPKS